MIYDMTAEDLKSSLIDYCKANANPELVKKYSRSFEERFCDAWELSQTLMDAKKRN